MGFERKRWTAKPAATCQCATEAKASSGGGAGSGEATAASGAVSGWDVRELSYVREGGAAAALPDEKIARIPKRSFIRPFPGSSRVGVVRQVQRDAAHSRRAMELSEKGSH